MTSERFSGVKTSAIEEVFGFQGSCFAEATKDWVRFKGEKR